MKTSYMVLALAVVSSGCYAEGERRDEQEGESVSSGSPAEEYTLFRSSPVDSRRPPGRTYISSRIHIAIFDAPEGEAYNAENCNVAASLFASQPGVTVRYWCERAP